MTGVRKTIDGAPHHHSLSQGPSSFTACASTSYLVGSGSVTFHYDYWLPLKANLLASDSGDLGLHETMERIVKIFDAFRLNYSALNRKREMWVQLDEAAALGPGSGGSQQGYGLQQADLRMNHEFFARLATIHGITTE